MNEILLRPSSGEPTISRQRTKTLHSDSLQITDSKLVVKNEQATLESMKIGIAASIAAIVYYRKLTNSPDEDFVHTAYSFEDQKNVDYRSFKTSIGSSNVPDKQFLLRFREGRNEINDRFLQALEKGVFVALEMKSLRNVQICLLPDHLRRDIALEQYNISVYYDSEELDRGDKIEIQSIAMRDMYLRLVSHLQGLPPTTADVPLLAIRLYHNEGISEGNSIQQFKGFELVPHQFYLEWNEDIRKGSIGRWETKTECGSYRMDIGFEVKVKGGIKNDQVKRPRIKYEDYGFLSPGDKQRMGINEGNGESGYSYPLGALLPIPTKLPLARDHAINNRAHIPSTMKFTEKYNVLPLTQPCIETVNINSMLPDRQERRDAGIDNAPASFTPELTPTDTGENEILCECGGCDDQGPMVCCDGCNRWKHQTCYGFFNEDNISQAGQFTCYECRFQVTNPNLFGRLKRLAVTRRLFYLITGFSETWLYGNLQDEQCMGLKHAELVSHVRQLEEHKLVKRTGNWKKAKKGVTFEPVNLGGAIDETLPYFNPEALIRSDSSG